MSSKTRPFIVIALLWVSAIVIAQSPREDASDYSKSEHQIAMRDGIKLYTAVYSPQDTSQKYPILMIRSPYGSGPYGSASLRPLGPNSAFAKEGYIFVYQDVRGRFMSEGDFKWMTPYIQNKKGPADVDESTDTYDTIEWLLKNIPNNNGRVGIYGISYPGFYTAAALVDPHPALKAASPQAPLADNYLGDDVHHNGAYWLPHTFNFISFFDQPRSGPTTRYPAGIFFYERDGYKFFLEMGPLANANNKYFHDQFKDWNDWMDHGDYDGYWQAQNVPQHLKKIATAVMTVGGWFDAEDLQGALRIYKALEKQNPDSFNVLVMGPWSHGGWAGGSGSRLGKVSFGSNTAAFYRESMELPFFNYYLKDKGQLHQPEAYVFETGSNQWKTYDQRFVSTRPDVLVYQTDVLSEDVTVAGPVGVNLVVSTSGTDSDFVVKLIDVQPDGYQMLVRGEPFRAKYRNSFSKPEPMTPGSPTKLDYEMPDVNHAFLKGHRIMVQVQSTWFPLMDRNPQKFVNIYKAADADFQKAAERVYHSASLSSQLKIRRVMQ